MSWPALGWAAKQKPGRVADKMVLIALADRHNEETDLAYPSIAWLAEFACLDRKTVVAALGRLEDAGLISDSGERVGKTKQVKAYVLHLNGTEKGSPKTEPLQPKSTAFSAKQSQKRDTEPSLEPSPSVSTKPSVKRARTKSIDHPMPANWEPSIGPKTTAMLSRWPPGKYERELRKFRNHAADKGRLSKDWDAAFRTWLENADEWMVDDERKRPQSSGSTATAAAGALAILEGRNAAAGH